MVTNNLCHFLIDVFFFYEIMLDVTELTCTLGSWYIWTCLKFEHHFCSISTAVYVRWRLRAYGISMSSAVTKGVNSIERTFMSYGIVILLPKHEKQRRASNNSIAQGIYISGKFRIAVTLRIYIKLFVLIQSKPDYIFTSNIQIHIKI